MSENLRQRIKSILVSTLQLEDMSPADLDDREPLMESGLGLDSIDALELVVAVEKEFGIKIKTSEEARAALLNIETLAAFIEERRPASPEAG